MGRSRSAHLRRTKRTSPIRASCDGSDFEAVCDLLASWQVRLKAAQVHPPALAAVVYEPDYRRRAVMDWRTERAPRTMILWKRRQL